jgi:hypothetical protein
MKNRVVSQRRVDKPKQARGTSPLWDVVGGFVDFTGSTLRETSRQLVELTRNVETAAAGWAATLGRYPLVGRSLAGSASRLGSAIGGVLQGASSAASQAGKVVSGAGIGINFVSGVIDQVAQDSGKDLPLERQIARAGARGLTNIVVAGAGGLLGVACGPFAWACSPVTAGAAVFVFGDPAGDATVDFVDGWFGGGGTSSF